MERESLLLFKFVFFIENNNAVFFARPEPAIFFITGEDDGISAVLFSILSLGGILSCWSSF